jgi:hypothetical protein
MFLDVMEVAASRRQGYGWLVLSRGARQARRAKRRWDMVEK